MTLATIQILWMDGKKATLPDVNTSVREGVLHIHQYTGTAIVGEWHFPTANIRWWTPVQDGGEELTLELSRATVSVAECGRH